jgi:hypothetical protein
MVVAKALKNVDITEEVSHFNPVLERDGGVYVSTIDSPILIQTPSLTLETDLNESDNFINVRLKSADVVFFKEVEEALLKLALANKATWFREDIADETIVQSLRSFLQEEDRSLRVRVSDGVVAFDAAKNRVTLPIPSATRVKAVLELARITFSKTQFGAVWNLKQVRLVEDTRYLFEEEATSGLVEDINESILLAEHDEELVPHLE